MTPILRVVAGKGKSKLPGAAEIRGPEHPLGTAVLEMEAPLQAGPRAGGEMGAQPPGGITP